jgi:hypothetical protein
MRSESYIIAVVQNRAQTNDTGKRMSPNTRDDAHWRPASAAHARTRRGGRPLPQSLRAALILLCWAAGSVPAQEPPDVNIFSFADTSCAEWQRSKDQEPLRTIYGMWFRGFVSGYNFGNSANQVALDKMPDPDGVTRYIDKYCQENPRLPFIGAAIQLVQEIREFRLPKPESAQ